MGPDAVILVSLMLSFKPLFHSPLLLLSRGSLVSLCFLPEGWCHLHIWGYWYFSRHPSEWLVSKWQEISVGVVGEDVEKREILCTGDENVNWCSHYRKHFWVWRFLKKWEIKLTYGSTILLLSVYPKDRKSLSQIDIFTPMFTAALLKIAKRWKQPMCPLMDKENVLYIF